VTTNGFDALLDRLRWALTGSTQERPGFSDAPALATALALVVAAFGFELANNTLGVDDYSHLDMPFRWDSFWIGRGTWGTLALQAVTPGGWITPFVSLAVGLSIQLLAAVILAWALRVRGTTPLSQALLYTLFATFPYFACQMAFSYVQIAYPLASLLMICSVVLALAGGAGRIGCAVVACAFAISIYQGSISVLGPVAVLAPIAHEEGRRETLRRYVRVLAVAAGAAALYVAAHRLILASTGITAQGSYYSVTFDWHFWERWHVIRNDIDYLFLGAGDVIPPVTIVIFLLAAAGAGAYGVLRQPGARRRLSAAALWVLLALALLVAPFAVLFFHAGQLAPRSSVGLAVVWFAVFAFLLRAPARAVRGAGLAALSVVVVLFVFQVNRMFFSQHLVAQADRLMMTRIAERIDQLPIDSKGEPIDVVVIGQYSHPLYAGMPRFGGDVLGFSQFEWNPADTRWAISGLARSIGVDRYRWLDAGELSGAFREPALLLGRSPWPHRSAVFAQDGRAVVWLGQRREEPRVAPLRRWYESFKARLRRQ
jgi:hypothetical protein